MKLTQIFITEESFCKEKKLLLLLSSIKIRGIFNVHNYYVINYQINYFIDSIRQ